MSIEGISTATGKARRLADNRVARRRCRVPRSLPVFVFMVTDKGNNQHHQITPLGMVPRAEVHDLDRAKLASIPINLQHRALLSGGKIAIPMETTS